MIYISMEANFGQKGQKSISFASRLSPLTDDVFSGRNHETKSGDGMGLTKTHESPSVRASIRDLAPKVVTEPTSSDFAARRHLQLGSDCPCWAEDSPPKFNEHHN